MNQNKYCKRCDKTLDVSLFTKSANRYDGLQVYCSYCMKLYRKEHYDKNKQTYISRAKISAEKMRNFLIEQKQMPCADCKIKYPPYVMDFDHLSNKVMNIARLVTQGSKEALIDEIAKCELVCANCHRERTYRRAQGAKQDSKSSC